MYPTHPLFLELLTRATSESRPGLSPVPALASCSALTFPQCRLACFDLAPTHVLPVFDSCSLRGLSCTFGQSLRRQAPVCASRSTPKRRVHSAYVRSCTATLCAHFHLFVSKPHLATCTCRTSGTRYESVVRSSDGIWGTSYDWR